MLKIYICEDNVEQREFITNVIEKYILMEDYNIHIEMSTCNPEKIIDRIEDGQTGLYFLDIDLNCDMNGLELAQNIRKKDKRGFIVFVTSHSEMSYMTFTYKVEAMDFIVKGDSAQISEKIKKCIKEAYERYASLDMFNGKVFTYLVGDREYSILYDDIVYFEKSGDKRKIVMHCLNGIMEFAGTIKEIKKKLDENFVKISKSMIINKKHIKNMDTRENSLTLNEGSVFHVTGRRIKELTRKEVRMG
ncbi:MAG: response regulator transcription factor [Lachnospiraceae bacterium]|nr:response regulator transcription factor [Lachnospiraceae bacterium]